METIERGSRALLAVLNDILDLSKIEAGKLDLEVAELDVVELVEDVGDLLARRAQEKGLELVIDIDPAVSRRMMGDATRLRQVLANLVSNAVKFTEEGEIVMRVRALEDTAEPRARLAFAVTDTGIGIDPDVQSQLFAPFTQADTSTTRKFGGTGLGLAIAHQIVALMGGNLRVESVPGHGSTFCFEACFGRTKTINAPVIGTSTLPPSRHILVIGGSPATQVALHRQLSAIDASIIHAVPADAEAAIAAHHDSGPMDAVIVAGGLASADLGRLGQIIRRAPAMSSTLLVVLTTHSDQAGADALRASGVDAVLTRPIRREPLLQAIATQRPTTASAEARGTTANGVPRILLVDDSPTNRLVMVTMLERLGYDVDAVSNGHDAIASFERAHTP